MYAIRQKLTEIVETLLYYIKIVFYECSLMQKQRLIIFTFFTFLLSWYGSVFCSIQMMKIKRSYLCEIVVHSFFLSLSDFSSFIRRSWTENTCCTRMHSSRMRTGRTLTVFRWRTPPKNLEDPPKKYPPQNLEDPPKKYPPWKFGGTPPPKN